MPISTFSGFFHRSPMEQHELSDVSYSSEKISGAARRKMLKKSSTVATMLSPSKFENPFLPSLPAFLTYGETARAEDGERADRLIHQGPSDASESPDELEDYELEDSPVTMLPQSERFEPVKRSAWGRPRGRKTIQDKIADQERRAADIERELRNVGLSSGGADVKSSPAAHKLSKLTEVPRTVPVSVIRKSPPISLSPDTNTSLFSHNKGPVFANLPCNIFPSEKVSSVAHLNSDFTHSLMLVPSVIFRLDGLRCPADQQFLQMDDNKRLGSSSPSPPASFSMQQRFESKPLESSSIIVQLQKPQREERLSTKLKRIKAVAGGVGNESPRGFLSQKIETLKRRESCLQQEYEEVINTPITPSGIVSAQDLQHRMAAATLIEQRLREPVLFQMLRNQSDWKRVRYS